MDTPKLQPISAMVSDMHYCIFATQLSSDPREYCISTKEFVVDGSGKLKGLNTGPYLARIWESFH